MHRNVIYWLTGVRPPVFVPVGGDRWVFAILWDPARGVVEDLSPSEVIPWIRAAAGDDALDVRVDRIALVPFGVDLAERFREGDVFLIGDAAHRVTPRGATGLNTAIRDGCDLGWKLAWGLRGWADEALLDSYEDQRRPAAEHNVERSADPNGSLRPVTAGDVDDLTARALGIVGRGALLVRPDGVPAALWADDGAAARGLHEAVASVTAGGSPLRSLAA